MGIAECLRQAGNHENIVVRAVTMTELLSHADVVRSIDMLRVWWSVGGCAKMAYGDVCDVPSDYADTSAQICGHSEKVHGAETDRLQLVLKKKVCLQAHQVFMIASDEDFQKVVNGAVAENRGTFHQDKKLMYRAKNLRSNCAVPWVNIAFNDVDASGCLWEEKQNERIDTAPSRLTTTDPSNAHSSM